MSAADDASSEAPRDAIAMSERSPALVPGAPDVVAGAYEGLATSALRELLGVPALHVFSVAGSTLDIAHRLAAAGAPHGTLVIADAQTRGRGRAGKQWSSPPGTGLWLTFIARPATADSVRVLTVRLGLAMASVLDRFARHRVQLKWPNDLYVGAGKVGGVLVEARWRGATPEWVAIGLGINVGAPPAAPAASGLLPGTPRVAVLASLVPAILAVMTRHGAVLDETELQAYASRDMAAGRRVVAPARGVVLGINAAAELCVRTDTGELAISSGSLVLSEAL
jgi:BirA family biotin operon repressor/biotin-[acetyl-CoA-carboxylase] ligase